jgi:hypothetical protein
MVMKGSSTRLEGARSWCGIVDRSCKKDPTLHASTHGFVLQNLGRPASCLFFRTPFYHTLEAVAPMRKHLCTSEKPQSPRRRPARRPYLRTCLHLPPPVLRLWGHPIAEAPRSAEKNSLRDWEKYLRVLGFLSFNHSFSSVIIICLSAARLYSPPCSGICAFQTAGFLIRDSL